jgi:tripartite-type tricarboxylate transporter receptor subunit TctC
MVQKGHSSVIYLLVFGLAFLFGVDTTPCANFPDKPIRVIVYQGPGSGTDMEARGILPYVQKHLGVSIAVENVPGAEGKIGLTRLWKSKPDGYTLLIHTTTQSLMGQILFNTEYRVSDFTPIFSWSLTNQVLVVNGETWKTFGEFTKDARTRALSAGLPGRGTAAHLMGLILADGLGIKVRWVPFGSGQDSLTALAGKHIDFAVGGSTTALPLVKAGKLRPLLVFAKSKDVVYPETPLPREVGHDFGIISALRGVDGPPNLPSPIIKTLEKAFSEASREPEYLSWAQKRMIEVSPLNHEQYRKAIAEHLREIEKYKDILKAPQ